MGVLTEAKHGGSAISLEMPGNYSRVKVTVLSGQNLLANAVAGRVKLGVGGIVAVLSGTSPGDGTMTLIFAGPECEEGAYLVQCTALLANNGTFSVTTPSGKRLPDAVMAGGTLVYKSNHINFTLTDGSTDFALTALFTVTVSTTAPLVQGGTGTGTISSITLGPDAKPGNYRVENIEAITNGGAFKVIGPDGDIENVGYVVAGASGTWVVAGHRKLNFTITDATDFIIANHFNVAVYTLAVGGKAVAWDPTSVDGRQVIAGILVGPVNASAGDVDGVMVTRNAVFGAGDLSWAAAITAAQKQDAYEEMQRNLNILVNS